MKSELPQLNKPLWTGALFALLGFLDASYLAIKHYIGGPIPCGILKGCDTVTTSSYSEIFGIPVALFGAAYYLLMLVFIALIIETKNIKILKTIVLFSTAAFIASLGFVYLQFFVIKAICVYCMGSALTSTILFALSVYMLKLVKQNDPSNTTVASI